MHYGYWKHSDYYTSHDAQNPSCPNLTHQPSLNLHTGSFLDNLFHKVMVAEKTILLGIYNTFLQTVKKFLNVKILKVPRTLLKKRL